MVVGYITTYAITFSIKSCRSCYACTTRNMECSVAGTTTLDREWCNQCLSPQTFESRSGEVYSIHLLTEYEGYSTFIVPKVPTIFWDNAQDNSWYRGDNESAIVGTEGTMKVLLPEYQVYKCFIVLNNCAIKNSKL